MFTKQQKYVIAFSAFYLAVGGFYFLKDLNVEFVIYVGVIIVLFSGVFGTIKRTQFPTWMLWMLSIWGLMHVLGGAVQTSDGVLFAFRIFPFIDLGGDFYVLKYDQVVHGYLYGLVGLMSHHVLRHMFRVKGHGFSVFLSAVLIAVGISGLNEIMEFFISIGMENGVGGYDNTMLDMVFNLGGAVIALSCYAWYKRGSVILGK